MVALGLWHVSLGVFHPRTVRIGKRTFTYRESGAGEAIVFLHGISSGSGSWINQLMHFQTRARCIAWDAPGYGGSSPLNQPFPTAAEYGEALKALMDALEIERAMLVGHSLGALMATSVARNSPSRVSGLALLDPAIGHASLPKKLAESRLQERLDQLREFGVKGMAEQRSTHLLSRNASVDALNLVRWNMGLLSPDGYTQAARMLSVGDLLADASHFAGPVMVASGSEDTITPEDQCRQVARAFPQGRYTSLPGLGHITSVEDPAAVNFLLTEFQKGLPHDK